MPARSPLLSRGRGTLLALGAALAIAAVAGAARRSLLTWLEPAIVSLPSAALRRLVLGLLLDLPSGVAAVLLCAVAGRLFDFSPLKAALALVATVVGLDVVGSVLVLHDMGLWTDPYVLVGRVTVLAASAFAAAASMGYAPWRERRQSREEGPDETPPV